MARANKRDADTTASCAELPQVVIDVKIGEALPFACRECAEVRMRFWNIVSGLPGEAVNQPTEFFHVGDKFDGRSASSLLIQFRS